MKVIDGTPPCQKCSKDSVAEVSFIAADERCLVMKIYSHYANVNDAAMTAQATENSLRVEMIGEGISNTKINGQIPLGKHALM